MHKPSKYFIVVPSLITLFLGWNLGVYYADHGYSFGNGTRADTASGAVAAGDPEREVNLSLFWNVWRLLQQKYIDPAALETEPMLFGAIGGMVNGIGDPFTVFMPPKESRNFRQVLEGTLQGIGAELTLRDGFVTVVTPLKGSPAERAGLAAGDIIAKVDDSLVQGMTLTEVVDRVRGPVGSTVRLEIVRQDAPGLITLSIVREEIKVPTVESKLLEVTGGPLGYVALNEFGEHSTVEVREALNSLAGKSMKGLIVDLRGNGGGYLEGAVQIASMFLKEGNTVTVQNGTGERKEHPVSGSPLFPDLPLAVLIDQGTASASEIVAGALQDYGRAKIIGMKSFGKGTVQEVIDLPGGSSLRVTVAQWLTPKGKNLGKEGVTPDITIERGKDDSKAGTDSQLQAAIDWLTLKKDDTK